MDYNAKHKAKNTIGICGVSYYHWGDMLEENNIRINSLSSCLFIYKVLLHKYKSKKKAIKHYKGIENKSNSYLVDKVILLEYKLKQINK